MPTRPDQPVFQLTFRATPDRVPAAKRVAQLLKHALRCLGLVCTDAVEVKQGAPATTPTATREAAGGAEATSRPS